MKHFFFAQTANRFPPPWLIAMQRYGPPPSYTELKIAGLNAPIPDGCSFGYHPGGWGKPPIDESGRPLYGDVFGAYTTGDADNELDELSQRALWGELEYESESSDEEEEDEADSDADADGNEDKTAAAGSAPAAVDQSGLVTPGAEGLITPSGALSAIPAGIETPDAIELRKKQIEREMEAGLVVSFTLFSSKRFALRGFDAIEGFALCCNSDEAPQLYKVLQEKRVSDSSARGMMASTHVYDVARAVRRCFAVLVKSESAYITLARSSLSSSRERPTPCKWPSIRAISRRASATAMSPSATRPSWPRSARSLRRRTLATWWPNMPYARSVLVS